MEVIIKLPEERFRDIQRIASVQLEERLRTAEQIIANGIILPRGHGRLIDADALLEKAYIPNTPMLKGWWHKETLEDVENAPTIGEVPKHGRWKQNTTYPNLIFCDECGEPFEQSNSENEWNYCPNCGARMENE